ncbi:AzlC family ABC transporter permease [soil metagenome]
MQSNSKREFRQGLIDIAPVVVASIPIGLLWGTLATAKGLSIFEVGLMSIAVYAGAAQFVAIGLWREPVPWLLLTLTVFIVNVRFVLMGASLARHMGAVPKLWRAVLVYFMADENWAFAERRALVQKLTIQYYFGLTLPMILTWMVTTVLGAWAGRSFGDTAAYGFDFAFSALFIGILVGFWKGPKTGAILLASAITAALSKHFIEGAWYIVLGAVAGVIVAAALHAEDETGTLP